MGTAETFTIKMDSEVKKELKTFCDEKGYKLGKFLERAAQHEIMEEKKKEVLAAFNNLEEREKHAVDFRQVAKKLRIDK